MRAVEYPGPGQRSWEEVPDPVLVADTGAIGRAADTGALEVVLTREPVPS